MKYLSENVLKNKNVILRCDFNVPIKDGVILDKSKILKSLDTIRYLLENNNKVIILSHFGRIKTEEDLSNNSLKIVFEELQKYIDVDFASNPLDIRPVIDSSVKKCILVENTRFTDLPEKRESVNDLDLAKYWSTFGDAFVLDAFGSMHRAHSSTAGIAKYLPTYIGLLAEKEIDNLDELIESDKHPFVVIMGGAKVDDKILVINNILKKCDKLILTGGILNTFLKVNGFNVGGSLASSDEKVLNEVRNILINYKDKLFFTNDFIVSRNGANMRIDIEKIKDGDIILDNIPDMQEVLNDSKIIFLNGTAGKYEDDNYSKGTLELFKELDDTCSKVYIGGGDTASAVHKFGFDKAFAYTSSGGGATLEYIATGKLKALDWIMENGVES